MGIKLQSTWMITRYVRKFPSLGKGTRNSGTSLILSMSNRDQFVHENLPVNLARSWRMQEGAITITKRNEDYPVPNVRCLLFSRILVTSTALFYKIYPVWSLRSSTYAEGNNFFSNSTYNIIHRNLSDK